MAFANKPVSKRCIRRRFWIGLQPSGSSLGLPGFRHLELKRPCRILPVAVAAGLRNSLPRAISHHESTPECTASNHAAAIDMQLAIQLALFLDNKPGTLERVCDALSTAKINIYAISTSDTVDHSVVRMVVSDPRKAMLLFEEHGTLVVETDVLLIEGDNKPGSLAKICHKLSAARINIEYAYCATPPDARKGLLILRVNNVKKAMKVLNT